MNEDFMTTEEFYSQQLNEAMKLIESQAQQIRDLTQDVAFLQSCVNSGETALISDRPSNRIK